ncbi:MAG: dihydrodiol dehydrogenase [Actinomycetota bacterium]
MARPDDFIDGTKEFPRRGETIVVGNEFAVVHLTKVYTRNGSRLEIESPRLGYTISLDPLELDSLTWQTPETFAEFLSSPYGPSPQRP